jgi:prepilin-type N-terminal cleavage/methylation domain-containing protein
LEGAEGPRILGTSDMLKKSNKKTREKANRHAFIKPVIKSLEPLNPRTLDHRSKGYTLIEIIIVIVILAIVAVISIKFLIDGMQIYTMTVNQKTLYDEGKLALEKMCRDIRDARDIINTTPSSIAFRRTNATTGGDGAGERIRFDLSGTTLQKVKGVNPAGNGGTPYAMANDVTPFTVTEATNEIQLTLTLRLTSGENVTLQTKVYPKNLARDTTYTYKNFDGYWSEAIQ